jgi:hypothetical protein
MPRLVFTVSLLVAGEQFNLAARVLTRKERER